MVKSRPYVILSAAMTIDGKIATKTGDSELSSKKDKKQKKLRIYRHKAKDNDLFSVFLPSPSTLAASNEDWHPFPGC